MCAFRAPPDAGSRARSKIVNRFLEPHSQRRLDIRTKIFLQPSFKWRRLCYRQSTLQNCLLYPHALLMPFLHYLAPTRPFTMKIPPSFRLTKVTQTDFAQALTTEPLLSRYFNTQEESSAISSMKKQWL